MPVAGHRTRGRLRQGTGGVCRERGDISRGWGLTGVLWITGVSGFTGRHRVRFLRQSVASVRIIGGDIDVGAAADLDAAHAIDLTDAEAVAALAGREPPDWVIHLAGLMPPAAESEMWRANVGGTGGLLFRLREGGRPPRVVSVGPAAGDAPPGPRPPPQTAPRGGAAPLRP